MALDGVRAMEKDLKDQVPACRLPNELDVFWVNAEGENMMYASHGLPQRARRLDIGKQGCGDSLSCG